MLQATVLVSELEFGKIKDVEDNTATLVDRTEEEDDRALHLPKPA